MFLNIVVVISALVYIAMMVHTFVNSSHGILPKRFVLWSPWLSGFVFVRSGYILYDHPYFGWFQTTAVVTSLISVLCTVDIYQLLGIRYVANIDISILRHKSLYLMKVAFAGCTSMLIALATLFLPLVW